MRKFYVLGLIGLVGAIIGFAWAEQITLTTYYPAPYGVYKEFKTTGNTVLAVGSGFVCIGAEALSTDAADADAKLEVTEGPIVATGGLTLPTEAPAILENGSIWLE